MKDQRTAEIEKRFEERMKSRKTEAQVPDGAPRPPRQSVAHLLAGSGQNRSAQVGMQGPWKWQENVVREDRVVDIDIVGRMREWYENER